MSFEDFAPHLFVILFFMALALWRQIHLWKTLAHGTGEKRQRIVLGTLVIPWTVAAAAVIIAFAIAVYCGVKYSDALDVPHWLHRTYVHPVQVVMIVAAEGVIFAVCAFCSAIMLGATVSWFYYCLVVLETTPTFKPVIEQIIHNLIHDVPAIAQWLHAIATLGYCLYAAMMLPPEGIIERIVHR